MSINNRDDFPRVSSGSLAAMLMEKVLQSQNLDTEIQALRSRDIIESLSEQQIDLAIAHRSSIDDFRDLSVTTLLVWKPVLISSNYGIVDDFKTIIWEKGSFGDILLEKFKNASPKSSSKYFGNNKTRKGHSYLSVLELIRRELPYKVVIPDIYLTKHDRNTLYLDYPDELVQDELIAVFREQDRERLVNFLNKKAWDNVFSEHISLREAR